MIQINSNITMIEWQWQMWDFEILMLSMQVLQISKVLFISTLRVKEKANGN